MRYPIIILITYVITVLQARRAANATWTSLSHPEAPR